MQNKTIDLINVWLLIVSFIIAIYLPFELFLFSYAILGPLHYLTEINWLDDKKYFIKSRSSAYKAFIVIALVIAAYPLLKYVRLINGFNGVFQVIGTHKNIILLAGFIFSVSLIYLTKLKHIIAAFFFSILFSVVSNLFIPKFLIVIGVFLPTLIHVYLFTLLFMVYGQLKSKSKPGIISIVLLIVAPMVIVFLDIRPTTYLISEFTKNTYLESGLMSLNKSLERVFGHVDTGGFDFLTTIGLKIQIFIAFAYTYHYLNWFSKTSIIGWKKSLTSSRMKYILFFWFCSIGLFIYDYVTGLIALFFLSLLHVVLEFPLNAITIKELILVSYRKLNRK